MWLPISFIINIGGHLPPPAGPAHWSTTVTVTPECRSQLRNGSNQRNDNGAASRYTTGATELHRQITIPTQHMHVNGQQNGNGHGKSSCHVLTRSSLIISNLFANI